MQNEKTFVLVKGCVLLGIALFGLIVSNIFVDLFGAKETYF